MNYLLVMPRFVDTVGAWYHFPLGIPYVSSCMKAAGLNVYISHSIAHLLTEKGRVAFWGINDYFANMLPNLPAVQSANAYLIDNSRIKQGGIVEGKEIHAPAILDELSIDTVVIPVVSYVTTIEKQILAEYPHVKEVINILDLIRPMEEDEILVC